MLPKKESNDIEKLLVEIKKLNKVNNSPKNVVIKGLLNGIFTAIGATIGFSVFIIFSASLINIIGTVPIVSSFLDNSGIREIIEYQRDKIREEQDGGENKPVNEIIDTSTGAKIGN